jgi:hypothetical protein
MVVGSDLSRLGQWSWVRIFDFWGVNGGVVHGRGFESDWVNGGVVHGRGFES